MLQIILVQGFRLLKIKITQFPGGFRLLYYYMRNFCNLIGSEQWYYSFIWNTYMSKLQTFCG